MISDDIRCNQMQSNAPVIQSNPNPNPNPNTCVIHDITQLKESPKAEEVAAWCAKNGIRMDDAEKFISYYARTNWRIRGENVDWREAARYWAKSGHRMAAASGGGSFMMNPQRQYSQAELDSFGFDLTHYKDGDEV